MGKYILRRLTIALPSLLGISLILFVLLALAPGDPFGELATNSNIPPEVAAALRVKFGIDDPILIRYVRWLMAMLQGDWGFSFASRINVDQLILQRIPTTLFVVGSSQILALAVALPVGVYAAMRPYSIFDQIANAVAFIGFSLPTFFTGLLLILIFSVNLGWLPFVYRTDIAATGWLWYWENFKQAIMPVAVLGLFQAASYTQVCALGGAGRDPARLCHDRALEGPRRTQGHRQARGSQRLDSGGDAGRAANARGVRRRHRHRADLPHSGHRLAADLIDSRQ